jgi:glycosyltransferase 2 family protein
MADKPEKILRNITPSKVILPIIIGFGIVGYLLYREWNGKALSMLTFSWFMLFFIVISFLMMALRDIGYMIRLRILSEGDISWKKIFNIIMLWEFASAVSPSAIGGTTFAPLFIHKEGLSLGKSTAIVLAVAFLDELYFLLMFPLVIFAIGKSALFEVGGNVLNDSSSWLDNKYFYFALSGYLIKFLFEPFLAYGLFVNPLSIKKLLIFIFKLPILRRWKDGAEKTGSDIVIASQVFRKKKIGFWIKAYIATIISWTARYWIVNFLLMALIFGLPNIDNSMFLSFHEHIILFARQLSIWIMLLVMPSPGGSGFAEAVFSDYLREFIPIGFVAIMAFLWRLVSYYPYLFMGVLVLPNWVKRVYSSKKSEE